MENRTENSRRYGGRWRKTQKIMKLCMLFLCAAFLQVSANTYSQEAKLDLKVNNASLEQVMNNIRRQSEFSFFFDDAAVKNISNIIYNKDILADAGLDEPSVDWTWDDLFDYAEKLKDPSANKFGLYGLNTDIFGLTNISVSEGGSPFVDSLTHTTTVTVDDKLKEAAEKVAGLIADGTIPGRTYETANQLSAFEAGEMGMLFYGQWEVDSLIRNCPDLNWGYAPIPKGSVKAAMST